MERIVVGVDGSEPSRDALHWGLDLAETVGGVEVVGVHVCDDVTTAYEKGFCNRAQADAWLAESRREAEGMLARMLDGRPVPEGSLRLETMPGQPAETLIEASRTADLLVVGPRGLGRLRGLLGSVTRACVVHAHVPVVVVRTEAP